MSDAQYRKELELELERLTKELADVRVEKAQQRQRIENLQLEQTQLKDQLGTKTAGDKELRTDLAQQLHTLHQVVRQKKGEHSKVKQEWERSQEQYSQLKQTVGLLNGTSVLGDSLQGDDLDNQAAQGKDAVQKMVGSMVIEHAALMSGLKAEQYTDSEAKLGEWDEETTDTLSVMTEQTKDSLMVYRRKNNRASTTVTSDDTDNGSVLTEQTKDSLQIHRTKQAKEKAAGGGKGGLGHFFAKQDGSGDSAARTSGGPPDEPGGASQGGRSKLGLFLDKERKTASE